VFLPKKIKWNIDNGSAWSPMDQPGPIFIWAKKSQVHFEPTFWGPAQPKIWTNGSVHQPSPFLLLYLFLIISYSPFLILIIGFRWDSNLIAQNYQTLRLPRFFNFFFFHFFFFSQSIEMERRHPPFLSFFFFHIFCSLPNRLKWNGEIWWSD